MNVTRKTIKKSYLKYIIALLLFGTNGIVASRISLDSYNIVLLRTMIGSVFMLFLFVLTEHKFIFRQHKKDLLYIIVSGIAMGASWMCLYEAYQQIGVSVASLLYYCGPVIVMLLSPFIFREKLTLYKIIGFIAVLFGIILVNGNGTGELNTLGVICGCSSALCYSVMVMANKKSENIIGFENSLIQLIVSFLTVAIFVGIKTGYVMQIESTDWVWIVLLGIVNTGIGCYFYFSSIGNLPVQTVAICGYLEPLSAVIFSIIILREVILPLQIIGAVLIIGGAIIGELAEQRKNHL